MPGATLDEDYEDRSERWFIAIMALSLLAVIAGAALTMLFYYHVI